MTANFMLIFMFSQSTCLRLLAHQMWLLYLLPVRYGGCFVPPTKIGLVRYIMANSPVRFKVASSFFFDSLFFSSHNCHIVSNVSEGLFDDSTRKLFPAILSKIDKDTESSTQELLSVRESIIKKCRQSPYRSHLQGSEGDVLGEEVELDFRRYLEENKISQGTVFLHYLTTQIFRILVMKF